MGGRPQKREKASGRKEWELGSTWNLKWTHVGIGFVVYVGTLSSFYGFTVYVGTGLRCPRFTLSSFYEGTLVQVYVGTVLRLKRGTGLRWYGFTIEAGDWVTLREC